MQRPRRFVLKSILALLFAILSAAAFWFGLVPQRLSPFAPLSLDEPSAWFVDLRLAALRRDKPLCNAVLKAPHIVAHGIDDFTTDKGCGWSNGVRVSQIAGAELPIGQITCEMAAALALWLEYEVQPLAASMLGTTVTRVRQMGSYACRNIIGNRSFRNVRSQHAGANALDIGGFSLADGRTISIVRDWGRARAESRFLEAIHQRSCRYFRVSLSPNFNAAHRDHFHFDRGPLWRCR